MMTDLVPKLPQQAEYIYSCTRFDYNRLDAEIRTLAQTRADEIKVLMKQTAENIIQIGQKLLEMKECLGHGYFGNWLRAEFEWSVRTAQQFINVASTFKYENFAHLDIAPSALYLLAAPSTPDSCREIALSRAAQGESITHKAAKAIVAEVKKTTGGKKRVNNDKAGWDVGNAADDTVDSRLAPIGSTDYSTDADGTESQPEELGADSTPVVLLEHPSPRTDNPQAESPMNPTSSSHWDLDALQQRFLVINLYNQEVGMKIERLASEHGKLPQTIVIWGIEALEVLPEREEKITKLECELRLLQKQIAELEQAVALKDDLLSELQQAVAIKDDKLAELESVGNGEDVVKAELSEKLAAAEYYSAEANTRITELERELAAARTTKPDLKEQSTTTTQPSHKNSSPSTTAPVPSSNPVPNLKSLIDFFDRAAEKLEKPTVQIVLNGNTIVVSRNSKSYVGKHPGVLNLNTWDGLWHGRVNRDGNLFKSKEWQDWVLPILEQFASNPGAIASQQGKTTGSCCFCNRVLTDARSLATGYGEVCATHYGLQWPLEQSGVGQPDVGQVDVGQSTSEIWDLQPTPNSSHLIPLKCGDSVQVISSRHGEEIVGKTGTVLDVTDVGCLVDVEGQKFFFSETEIALFPVELPF